jgi:hypothetical protein
MVENNERSFSNVVWESTQEFCKIFQQLSAIVVNNKSTTLINTLLQLGVEQFQGTPGNVVIVSKST